MDIAVTGATGHIGVNLCRMLAAQGHRVRVLVRRQATGLEGLPLESVKGDVLAPETLFRLCRGCEVVFHLAAAVTIRRRDPACVALNLEGSRNLLQAAARAGVRRIVHFSSVQAYRNDPAREVLDESAEPAEGSSASYDLSKALSQQLMLAGLPGGPEVVVLNPAAVVGPYDVRPSLTGNAILRFYRGQNPALVPGGFYWVDVRDVCGAALRAMTDGGSGECYLLPGHWHSLHYLAGEIARLGGHPAPRLRLPLWLAMAGAPFLNAHARITRQTPLYTAFSLRTMARGHTAISGEKAARILGFIPRPLPETLRDTLQWFKENHYL